MVNKETVEKCVRLFAKRFSEKDIAFEMRCGYFWEWCNRIESGNAKGYADSQTLVALEELKID